MQLHLHDRGHDLGRDLGLDRGRESGRDLDRGHGRGSGRGRFDFAPGSDSGFSAGHLWCHQNRCILVVPVSM